MPDIVFLYMTAPSKEEALKIARVLVQEQWVACVNVLPQAHSVYRWEGKVQESEETVLIAKTRANLFKDVEERVRSLHSNVCPCILALPVHAGASDFLEWVDQSTM